MATADITSVCPQMKRVVTKTSSGSDVISYISDLGGDAPILTLIHGYPSSAYSMRYLPPIFADKVSLFVPELPGYGISTPQEDCSKRAIGATLLEALQEAFNINGKSPRKLILGGHDRGARVCHRLAVDKDRYPAFNILGVVLLDIVPTRAQWQAFANPAVARSGFHWPMLSHVEISVKFIKGYGGGNWARDTQYRSVGKNEEGRKRLEAHGAIEVYYSQFEKEEALIYTAKDYNAGATIDYEQQEDDQKAGRKIDVPTLVMFSHAKLGRHMDVENIWKDWVKPGVSYKGIAIGDDYGHYLTEEAYDVVSQHILTFIGEIA